jgi:hypothetical protein
MCVSRYGGVPDITLVAAAVLSTLRRLDEFCSI